MNQQKITCVCKTLLQIVTFCVISQDQPIGNYAKLTYLQSCKVHQQTG